MIVNATHIGKKLDGIGRFSLILAKYFIKTKAEVIINANATIHFNKDELKKLKIVTSSISPDNGFLGHLKRIAFTNKLKGEILNLSQLEVSFFNKEQTIVVHDIIPLLFPKYHKKQYHFFKYILPSILKHKTKHIITVSNHTKELLIKYYNLDSSKITVIYNGVDLECKNEQKEEFFLFVGRDSPTKNIDRLIEAFSTKELQNIKLKMVGVKRDIKNKNIETLGYMDEKSLKNLYAKAKYFIFPSLYEGFGFPAIEAMRCRCGVVVSNISSLPEICKDGVLYINPNDTNDIINKVKLISSDNKLYKHLTNKAYNISKNYSWDSAFKKYMEVIDESSNNS